MRIVRNTNPESLFYSPGLNDRIIIISSDSPRYVAIPRAEHEAIGLSESDQVTTETNKHIKHLDNHVRFKAPLMCNTFVAKLSHAKAAARRILIDRNVVLNQSPGIRFLNRYIRRNPHYHENKKDVTEWLLGDRGPFQLPPQRSLLKSDFDLPYLIILKNGFNFYHFVDEVLRQFATISTLGAGYTGAIFILSPNLKLSRFIEDFIYALYPQFRGRLRFTDKDLHFEDVLVSYDINLHAITRTAGGEHPILKPSLPKRGVIKGYNPIANLVRTHRANIVPVSYAQLRKRAIERSKFVDVQASKRIFVERGSVARDRTGNRHDDVTRLFIEHGFTPVVLEDHTPLEQIAFVSSADMVAGFHGAGFSHLLFGKAKSKWIEIGTLQTLRERWLDFWHLANTSLVDYKKYCLDFDKKDPFEYPNFAKESIVAPRVTKRALERIAAGLEQLSAD